MTIAYSSAILYIAIAIATLSSAIATTCSYSKIAIR